MDVPIHHGINEPRKYEELRFDAELLVELLGDRDCPNPNVKLLMFNNYIDDQGITFPNAQIEEDFIKTVKCNRNPITETMLEMYVNALKNETKRVQDSLPKQSWLEKKVF